MIHSATLVPVLAAIGAKDVLLAVFALVLLGLLAAFLCLRGRIRASVVEQTRADFSEELLSRFRRGMESRIGGGGATTDPQDGMDRILAYANIAEALSGGYECIYYIDLDTNRFDQYRSSGLYETLKVEKAGEDFFGLTQSLLPSTMHPDDVPRMAAAFTHDAMVEATMGDRVFSIAYRLNIEGDYLWYCFRAVRAAGDRNHLVAAVSNVDEQMRREKGQEPRPPATRPEGAEPPSRMKLSPG